MSGNKLGRRIEMPPFETVMINEQVPVKGWKVQSIRIEIVLDVVQV